MATATTLPLASPREQNFARQNAAEVVQNRQPLPLPGPGAPSAAAGGAAAAPRSQRLGRDVNKRAAPMAFAGTKAKQLQKQYEVKLKMLKNDLGVEANSMNSDMFRSAFTYTSDFIGLIPFVKVVLYPIIFFLKLQHIWNMSNIRYENTKRKIQRTIRLKQRAFLRWFVQMIVSPLAFIPVFNLIPLTTIFKWWDARARQVHKKKLERLQKKVHNIERKMNIISRRATTGRSKYAVAHFGFRAVTAIEQEFDRL